MRMKSRFCLVIWILFVCLLVNAQEASKATIHVLSKVEHEVESSACVDQDAGSVTRVLPQSAMSSDIQYLCFGDSMYINHNGDQDLTGDPNPLTQPGITYGFFNCAPSSTGPYDNIRRDPCNIVDPVTYDSFTDTSIWIVASNITAAGNTSFWNLGDIQNFFNNGDPVEMFFTPLTVDDATIPMLWGWESVMGGPAGPCTHASTSETFSVVYLNAITASNPQTSVGGDPCTGSFVISGGLPQYDGTNYLMPTIRLSGSAIQGTLTGGPYSHGDVVTFTVPQAGVYNIILEDGVSCEGASSINMANCGVTPPPDLEFDVSDATGAPGDTVCLDFNISNFQNILLCQFSLDYDPALIEFVSLSNPILPNGLFGVPDGGMNSTTPGDITFSWDDPYFLGQSIADGDLFVTICFEILGNPGDCAIVNFTSMPTNIECVTAGYDQLAIDDNGGGKITIDNTGLEVIDTLISNVTCAGDMNGSIDITVMGGSGAYLFNWSNNAQTEDISNLSGGQYTVTVLDPSDGSQIIETYIVLEPLTLNLNVISSGMASCHETVLNGPVCDGTAEVTASGGNGGYRFVFPGINISADTAMTNMLCPGFNVIEVRDDSNCVVVDSIFIGSPDSIMLSPAITEPLCHGGTDGSVTITASGGTSASGNYNFVWQDGTPGASLINVGAADYLVTITDDNMCMFEQSVTVTEPDSLIAQVDLASSTDVLNCNGGLDGLIRILTTGGNTTNGYMYTWSPDVSTSDIANNLSEGSYDVTVMDANGCIDFATHTITAPDAISAIIPTPTLPACGGQQTTVTVDTAWGGTGMGYMFSVDNSFQNPIGSEVPVFAGNHIITVFDSDGCIFETDISVVEPPPLVVELGLNTEILLGDDLVIQPIINSQLPILDFVWTSVPLDTVNCLDSLCTRINVMPLEDTYYTIVITDENGCTATDEILVQVDNQRNVYIPNIFSPNNDGRNDKFRVYTGQGVEKMNFMRIFDRWGNVLLELDEFLPSLSDADAAGWDGKVDGIKVTPGVYVYLIEVQFIDGRTLLYRGDITVIR